MDYEFLHSCFPNYTLAMWQGNKPKNHTSSINGDYFDNYEDMEGNGSCQAYHDVAVSGEWSFAIIESLLVIAVSSMASICFTSCTIQAMIRSIGYIEMTMVFVVWLIYLMPQKSPISQKPNYAKSLIRKINLHQNVGKCFMKRP